MHPARLPILAAAAVAVALPTPTLPAQTSGARGSATVTSVTVQQRMIIRVPRLPAGPARTVAPAAPTVRWTEKKADKCIALIDVAAAAITEKNSVDLILNGGQRLRASFGSECRALDFYSGFYVRMTPDRKACAGRDAFRARSGGECRIKAFRKLVPDR